MRARGVVFHRDPEGLRCAGQEYLRLLRGQWYFTAYARLRPWDHSAGVVIHGEAGGFSGYLKDRSPYHVARGEDLEQRMRHAERAERDVRHGCFWCFRIVLVE